MVDFGFKGHIHSVLRFLGICRSLKVGTGASSDPETKERRTTSFHYSKFHMGGCQNHGPLLGPLNTMCHIMLRTPKGTTILTTTHIPTYWSLLYALACFIAGELSKRRWLLGPRTHEEAVGDAGVYDDPRAYLRLSISRGPQIDHNTRNNPDYKDSPKGPPIFGNRHLSHNPSPACTQ